MKNTLLALALFLVVISATLHGHWLDKLSRKRESFWGLQEDFSYLGPLDTIYCVGVPLFRMKQYQYYPDDAIVIEDGLVTEASSAFTPKFKCQTFPRKTPNPPSTSEGVRWALLNDFEQYQHYIENTLSPLEKLLDRLKENSERQDDILEGLHKLFSELEIQVQRFGDSLHQISNV